MNVPYLCFSYKLLLNVHIYICVSENSIYLQHATEYWLNYTYRFLFRLVQLELKYWNSYNSLRSDSCGN